MNHYLTTFIEFKKEDIEQSIPNRFEQQVNRHPNQIAVKTKNQKITYEQLNNMANRLAYAIRSQLGKEPIVLLLEKDASLIATMLGVLKVGKIYVPLDTSFPKFRLLYMLDNSQAVLIITNNKNIALAHELAQGSCQLLNIDDIQYSGLSTENLGLSISPDTPAYIIYTSGSTGQPKGIVHNHRNTLHNIRTTTNAFHIVPNDRITFLHASGVMSAIRGIFSTLLNGATLYPIDVNNTKLSDLNNVLIQEEITVYYSVPTLFRTVVNGLTGTEAFPKLRLVILTGEPVLKKDIELYKKYFSSNCILGTGLGTSETGTVRVCSIDKDTKVNNSTAPLGYAVDDIEIMLLDDAGAEVGIGNIGEITVKSRYIAQGYWQNLSEAAFRQDQAGGNEYIYRTGDMGRMLPDGCLFHHGRKDFQVKIRGYRVELSEIEMALQQHPVIKEVVVMAVGESPEDKQLVAYFVCHQSTETNDTHTKQKAMPNTLRRFSQDKLPDYMVPSAFVKLEAMPLTPNGKVDRSKLLIPAQTQQNHESFVAPQDKLEQQLANLWEKVLHVHPIGRYDNFFERGGHSLLAVTLLSQIEKAFGKGLSMMTIFQAPTITQFADVLRAQGYKATWRTLETIQPQGSRSPLFFIGSTNYARALVPSLGTEQPLYGLNLFGLQPTDGTTPSLTVEWIAEQYIQEIQMVQPEGPYYLCGYCGDAKVAFEIAQQLQAQKQSVALLAFIDVVWRTSSTPSQNRYVHFWRNLLEFGPHYFYYKIQEKLKFFQGRLLLRLSKLEKKRHEQTEEALPLQLQHKLLIKSFFKALAHYVPQPYLGHITLFLSYEWRSKQTQVLTELAAEGVKIHEIPGYHHNLFESSKVDNLGKLLKRCLAG